MPTMAAKLLALLYPYSIAFLILIFVRGLEQEINPRIGYVAIDEQGHGAS